MPACRVGGPGSGKAELAREALQGRQGWTVLDTGQLFRDYLDRLAGEEVEGERREENKRILATMGISCLM